MSADAEFRKAIEPGDVAGTLARIDQPGVDCVELPVGLVTAGEIIMAGVRARPVRCHPLADREGLPESLDRLPSPPEEGFDRQGRAYLDNLEADLADSRRTSPTNSRLRRARISRPTNVEEPEPPRDQDADPANGCVVLIDEIDKAESEVPNGLLEALGNRRFVPLGCRGPRNPDRRRRPAGTDTACGQDPDTPS
jgi:hypothetical protein